MPKLAALCVLPLTVLAVPRVDPPAPTQAGVDVLFVDPAKGDDSASGARERPLKTISAALARVPDPLERSMSIELASGTYATTGGQGMPERSLQLVRRMRPGVEVRLHGSGIVATILAWRGDDRMIEATEGRWSIENVRIGTFERTQRRGVMVSGACDVALKDVELRLRSNSDAALHASRCGRIALRGSIRINDSEERELGDESFSGIVATDHGIVEFDEREGSSLVLGNGSLAASYWGSIRLGCERARITSRSKSNCISVCNSGRIDLRNTATTLRATDPKNTPIGLEDDGHVLAEDAVITIEGKNDSAIALQKASTLACNDVALKGEFEHALWASSGSMFVGRFVTDAGKIEATTGASIHVEKLAGKIGDVTVKSGAVVSLPDRVVTSR